MWIILLTMLNFLVGYLYGKHVAEKRAKEEHYLTD